ncbi:hypothetical protein E2C01_004568 [Portunus trituberculatus]|uniref:Uncharacterized protein n=1 Tax=Portunus trituberculatus TaxID=210409 RepID=A0A5B7CWS1_PORTR|nr:hypothetical protein [Portunus trituberculatus]
MHRHRQTDGHTKQYSPVKLCSPLALGGPESVFWQPCVASLNPEQPLDETPYYSGLLVVLHPPPASILVTAGYRSTYSPPLHSAPFFVFSLGSCTHVLPGTAVCEVDGRGIGARAATFLSGDQRQVNVLDELSPFDTEADTKFNFSPLEEGVTEPPDLLPVSPDGREDVEEIDPPSSPDLERTLTSVKSFWITT